ncbi:MAG: thiamine phosphate synthase [Rhodothermales bacterium]|nr:thiamine phosphate synthase [Rhodothermales bacterium]
MSGERLLGGRLPRTVLVADRFTDPAIQERVIEAVSAGIGWVQLRDHAADACSFGVAVGDLVRRIDPTVFVSVNTRAEYAGSGVAGVHLGSRGPSVEHARRVLGPDVWIGYSAHTLADARAAETQGADYLFFSPVYPTTSKPGASAAGLDALAACCAAVALPVFALGGVTPERVAECRSAGAYGVAVVSGILGEADVEAAVRRYRISE